MGATWTTENFVRKVCMESFIKEDEGETILIPFNVRSVMPKLLQRRRRVPTTDELKAILSKAKWTQGVGTMKENNTVSYVMLQSYVINIEVAGGEEG